MCVELYTHVIIYIYICVCIYIYTHIYIHILERRERDRERERARALIKIVRIKIRRTSTSWQSWIQALFSRWAGQDPRITKNIALRVQAPWQGLGLSVWGRLC